MSETYKSHLNMCGGPVTIATLEWIVKLLNENGEVHVTHCAKGGADLMMLGAVLAAEAVRSRLDMMKRPEK